MRVKTMILAITVAAATLTIAAPAAAHRYGEQHYHRANGSFVTERPNGAVVVHRRNGTRVVHRPNGDVIVKRPYYR